jgi:hypothetical protein
LVVLSLSPKDWLSLCQLRKELSAHFKICVCHLSAVRLRERGRRTCCCCLAGCGHGCAVGRFRWLLLARWAGLAAASLRDALSQGCYGSCFSCHARAKPTPQLPAPSRRAALLLLPVTRALGRCRGDRRGVGGALSLPPELVVAATISLT